MTDQKDATKPEDLKDDLEPAEDPKGGILIGLNQPTLLPAVQLPAVQNPVNIAGKDILNNPTK
jgi:hypothetical protein